MRPDGFDDHDFGRLVARRVEKLQGDEVVGSSRELRESLRLDADTTRYSFLTIA